MPRRHFTHRAVPQENRHESVRSDYAGTRAAKCAPDRRHGQLGLSNGRYDYPQPKAARKEGAVYGHLTIYG